MTEHLYGESIRLTNTFTDSDGDVYDPDTISLTIYDTEGTSKKVVTYVADEIKKSSTGIYVYDYTIPSDSTSQGYWIGVWTVVIGVLSDVSEEQFYVRPAAEKLYISVSEVKTLLMSTGVTMNDDDVRNSIRSGMGECNTITGREFTNANTKTEWFSTNQANPNSRADKIFLSKLPVQSITSLKEYDAANVLAEEYTSDEFWFDDNGIVELATGEFTHQRHRVQCVYTYGYTSVPSKISKLCGVISQIEVLRNYMIAQDDKMTGFDVPDIGSVQLGETYMTAQLAIKELEDQKKILVAEIGNLRFDVFVV